MAVVRNFHAEYHEAQSAQPTTALRLSFSSSQPSSSPGTQRPMPPSTSVLTKGTQCALINHMKPFEWSNEKNRWLKQERGIGFEEVVFAILEGKLVDIVEHPNPDKYPNQRIYLIELDCYIYAVPYEEKEDAIVLKTLFPTRKYTKIYLGKDYK